MSHKATEFSKARCCSKWKPTRLDARLSPVPRRWGYVVSALAMDMDAPPIVFGFRPTVLVGLLPFPWSWRGCSGRSSFLVNCRAEGGFSNR
ncbi:MAG: hypothetical protein CM15mP18_2210 [Methanobacteriota archaeon]|nr:MAG: hypothetical protein CM15mP18_2210 [Euryarchaeota archaeon]